MTTRHGLERTSDSVEDPDAAVDRSGDPRVGDDVERCRCGLVSDDAPGEVYNEEAFRYFFEVERKRSERSCRPFLLLLVDLKKHPAATPEIDGPSARKIFSALSLCVRETDFVGWYRERSVVGAVLTQHGESASDELQQVITRRVSEVLNEGLSPDLASLVQVRVYQVPVSTQGVS